MLVSKREFADIFVVFDVFNIVGRCEGAPCGTLTNSQGYPTNPIDIGLSKVKAMAEIAGLSNRRVCLTFSAQENRLVRQSVYPDYKGKRPKKAPLILPVTWWNGDDCNITYDGVRDFMNLMQCIPSLTIGMPNNNGETDDAIASFCHEVYPKPCYVVTEDRDMWSLMSDRVTIFSKPDKPYSLSDLINHKKFAGISEPTKLGLAKALFGDDSDCIKPTIPRVTQTLVGEELRNCRKIAGEKQWAPAFYRELESRKNEKALTSLIERRAEVEYAERWIRLRRVELNYRHGVRDLETFKKIIEWFEVKKKFANFMKFAQS